MRNRRTLGSIFLFFHHRHTYLESEREPISDEEQLRTIGLSFLLKPSIRRAGILEEEGEEENLECKGKEEKRESEARGRNAVEVAIRE